MIGIKEPGFWHDSCNALKGHQDTFCWWAFIHVIPPQFKMLDLSSVRRAVASTELQQKSDSSADNGSRSAKSLDNSVTSEENFDENSHHNNPGMHPASSTLLLQKAMLEAMMNKSASEKYERLRPCVRCK